MNAWLRQKNERKPQFEALQKYLSLGKNRSLENLCQKFGMDLKKVKSYSDKWEWQQRAEAYDAHTEKIVSRKSEKSDTEHIEKDIVNHDSHQPATNHPLESALNLLISKICERFELDIEEIDNMKLEEVVKLASAFIKSVPDFQKALDILESWKKDKMISDDIALDEIIRDDPEASELVAKLLERISELRD